MHPHSTFKKENGRITTVWNGYGVKHNEMHFPVTRGLSLLEMKDTLEPGWALCMSTACVAFPSQTDSLCVSSFKCLQFKTSGLDLCHCSCCPFSRHLPDQWCGLSPGETLLQSGRQWLLQAQLSLHSRECLLQAILLLFICIFFCLDSSVLK